MPAPAWLTTRPLPRAIAEGALLAVLALLAGLSASLAPVDVSTPVLLGWGLAPLLALWWRRDAPLTVFALVLLLAAPSRILAGANGPAELMVLVVIYTVATRRALPWTIGAVLLDTMAMGVCLWVGAQAQPEGVELVGQLAAGIVAGLLGMYVQSRRTAEQILRERADRLDRERELNARAAVEEERRRIARELHDVVAHHVSVMTLKAGALEKRLKRSAAEDELAETAASVRHTGQQAMTELRRLLGLLHRNWDDQDRAPQPDLDALELLTARMRDAGMPLELHVSGPTEQIGAGMSLAAYRIIQEALTNTLKHAGPVPTSVHVAVNDAEVEIRIRDQGAEPAAPPHYPSSPAEGGHGLVGMRERAALFAGTVTADHHPDGGFEVHARLPRHAAGRGGRPSTSAEEGRTA